MILIKDIGPTEYSVALALQREEFGRILAAKRSGVQPDEVIFLTEHSPVYTLGKHARAENLLLNEEELVRRHIDVFRTDRGGDITFHGPGQLVVYPIIDLECRHLGIKRYVEILEECIIMTLSDFGLRGERLSGAPGVWLDPHLPSARKICALGVRCSRFVTMHGFALNVNTDMDYFAGINPCGFIDKGVTSISRERGETIVMDDVRQSVIRHLTSLLDSSIKII